MKCTVRWLLISLLVLFAGFLVLRQNSARAEEAALWAEVVVVDDEGEVLVHRVFSDGTEDERRYGTQSETSPGRKPCFTVYVVSLGKGEPVAEVEGEEGSGCATLMVQYMAVRQEVLEAAAEDRPAPTALVPETGTEPVREYRKSLTYYSSDDRPLWTIETDSLFRDSRYRDGTGQVTVFDDAWESEELTVTGRGGVDRDYRCQVHCVMVRRVLGIPVARIEVDMQINSRGSCEVKLENRSIFRSDRSESLEL